MKPKKIRLPRSKKEMSIIFTQPEDGIPSGTLLSVEEMIEMIARSENISVFMESEDDPRFDNLMPWLNAVAKNTEVSLEVFNVTAEHKFLATITKERGCEASLVEKILISTNGMFFYEGKRYLLFDVGNPTFSKENPNKL